jgi:hypothetical protein
MEQAKKLQDLEVSKKYKVLARKEIIGKYGRTYVLKVVDQKENEFELYSPKYITTYIDNESPKGPFEFVVQDKNNVKYPVIENYNQHSNGFISF